MKSNTHLYTIEKPKLVLVKLVATTINSNINNNENQHLKINVYVLLDDDDDGEKINFKFDKYLTSWCFKGT